MKSAAPSSGKSPAYFHFPLVLAAAVCLRGAMFFRPKSVWGDEIYSLDFALRGNLSEVLGFSFRTNHPPGYYGLLFLLSDLFGHGEIVFRSASFVAGALTTFLTYRLARLLFGRAAAFTAAWFYAISPYALHGSHEIRSYGLLGLWGCATVYFFLKSLKKSKYIPVYVLFAATIAYIEHIGIFATAACGLVALLFRHKRHFAAQAVVSFLLIPWLFLVGHQAFFDEKIHRLDRLTEYWNPAWMLKKGAGVLWQWLCGYRFSMVTVEKVREYAAGSPWFWTQAVAALAGTAVFFARWWALRARPRIFWLVTAVTPLPFLLLLLLYPIRLNARYLSFAFPLFLSVWADGLNGMRPAAARKAATAFFGGVMLFASLQTIGSSTDAMHKEDYRSMVRHAVGHAGPGEAVIGSEPFYRYYVEQLGLEPRARYFPLAENVVASDLEGVSRVWFLAGTNMHPDKEDAILLLDTANLRRLGFEEKSRVRFGGELATTVLSVHERSDRTG